jgi:hypothetical protein
MDHRRAGNVTRERSGGKRRVTEADIWLATLP